MPGSNLRGTMANTALSFRDQIETKMSEPLVGATCVANHQQQYEISLISKWQDSPKLEENRVLVYLKPVPPPPLIAIMESDGSTINAIAQIGSRESLQDLDFADDSTIKSYNTLENHPELTGNNSQYSSNETLNTVIQNHSINQINNLNNINVNSIQTINITNNKNNLNSLSLSKLNHDKNSKFVIMNPNKSTPLNEEVVDREKSWSSETSLDALKKQYQINQYKLSQHQNSILQLESEQKYLQQKRMNSTSRNELEQATSSINLNINNPKFKRQQVSSQDSNTNNIGHIEKIESHNNNFNTIVNNENNNSNNVVIHQIHNSFHLGDRSDLSENNSYLKALANQKTMIFKNDEILPSGTY